ncbi:PREDICTED: poly [ADP-ribose] polymerase 3-like [Amphimedon queenslandica]|uniref:Poly [ADP-ribose] polymerase n=1 Tax=Amphimedon queenslandica TaxID=400682 RepID=A0A1X7VTK5_AMPQE|nr:PREDICTED: poly [ADP-ribose] polymerase 3-like [Amphimedon queenslandica]|eukprot:XP_019856101.1 PREDICTED: poly [ADP-ribose] polymerase 3-like [Amphimedon queenslandica]
MPPKKRQRKTAAAKEEDEPTTSAVAPLNPAALTVTQLRAELSKKGLDTTGKKALLVQRLTDSLKSSDEPSTTKKAKTEDPAEDEGEEEIDTTEGELTYSKAAAALRQADKKEKGKRQRTVDTHIPWYTNYEVVDDWDCMLNQTNIGHNNNKFYVIQLLSNKNSGYFHVWNRWGRVGEPGMNAMKGPFHAMDAATKEFAKKFKDKTKNDWSDRDSFTPHAGKYTLIEMGGDDDEDEPMDVIEDVDTGKPKKIKPCTLDKPTQNLVKLIFDNDMFREAMKTLEIDTKKMPLGKLSKAQIAKGFEALEALESALQSKASRAKLSELSSKFYTIIPHDFGRRIPPVIDNQEHLQKKFDMLTVLGDIEIAQSLQKDKIKTEQPDIEEVPHEFDVNYASLKAKLEHVKKEDSDYKIIETYLRQTEPSYRKLEIVDIWRVSRDGEAERFSVHDSIENRRLLWHGTNVAVVAAILKSGLRIMPHSGGRVGRGIYFASENSKSAGYVGCANNIGIMFLNEVALGKEHSITRDDSSLVKAPAGHDSVVARGHTEPDPALDTTITIDGKTVTVPQGKPKSQQKYSTSSFSQTEYLIYKESQNRIRYLLKLKFGGHSFFF